MQYACSRLGIRDNVAMAISMFFVIILYWSCGSNIGALTWYHEVAIVVVVEAIGVVVILAAFNISA